MAEVEPFALAGFAADIVELALAAVADEEEIAERLDALTLLAFAEQRRDRQVEVLAEQVEQRGFNRRDRMERYLGWYGKYLQPEGVPPTTTR